MTHDRCLFEIPAFACSELDSSCFGHCVDKCHCVVSGSSGTSRPEHFVERSLAAGVAWAVCWKRAGLSRCYVSGCVEEPVGGSVHTRYFECSDSGCHLREPARMAQLLRPVFHGAGFCPCFHCFCLPCRTDRWTSTDSNDDFERCHHQLVSQCCRIPVFFPLLSRVVYHS